LALKKDHVLCKGTKKFAITRYLQVLLCLLGQSKVFEEASEMLEKLVGLKISGMQIQRISEFYGEQLDPAINRNIESCIPKLSDVKKEDVVYVMADGSMLLTRDEKWKEVKLARIFTHDSILKVSDKRSEIINSVYVSHMGGVGVFLPKLERHLNGYKNKVIIGDGAKWIWNWAEDNYPGATQILDFFHAKEKLVLLTKIFFKEQERQDWIDIQCKLLMEDKVHQVIENIKKLRCKSDEAKELKEKTLHYYEEHEERMFYKTYRDRCLLIGSGPIEAAHRSVLQSRMKLSGQKWSIKGVNAIANLRCLYKSNAWHILEKIVNAAA
jgi:hypothetical protein